MWFWCSGVGAAAFWSRVISTFLTLHEWKNIKCRSIRVTTPGNLALYTPKPNKYAGFFPGVFWIFCLILLNNSKFDKNKSYSLPPLHVYSTRKSSVQLNVAVFNLFIRVLQSKCFACQISGFLNRISTKLKEIFFFQFEYSRCSQKIFFFGNTHFILKVTFLKKKTKCFLIIFGMKIFDIFVFIITSLEFKNANREFSRKT